MRLKTVLGDINLVVLITEFQDGLPWELRERMNERFQTIIILYSLHQRLPNWFRPLKCFPDKVVNSQLLCLPTKYRDCRFPLHLAIAEGELKIVQLFYKHKRNLFGSEAILCAINFKQHDIINWLYPILWQQNAEIRHNRGINYYLGMHDEHQEILEPGAVDTILKNAQALNYCDPAQRAVEEQNFAQFKKAMMYINEWTVWNIIVQLGEQGHLSFVQALVEEIPDESRSSIFDILFQILVYAGRIQILDWMREDLNYIGDLAFTYSDTDPFGNLSWSMVVEVGNADMMKWIYKMYPRDWSQERLDPPASVNNIAVVELLLEMNHPLKDICPLTLEIAEFLVEHGVEITPVHLNWACGDVVASNHRKERAIHPSELIKIVQLYHQVNPQLQFQACHAISACRHGALDVLKLLFENINLIQVTQEDGINILENDAVIKSAIESGSLESVKYLHEVVGYQIPSCGLELAITAGKDEYGEVDYSSCPLLEYILNKDVEWSFSEESVLYGCTLETLEWLFTKCKCLGTCSLLIPYVRFGQVDLLPSIANRTKIDRKTIKSALFSAVDTGATNMLEYLWTLYDQNIQTFNLPPTDILSDCDFILHQIHQKKIMSRGAFDDQWTKYQCQIEETKSRFS